MPLQYSQEEIDSFIGMLQRDAKRNLTKSRMMIPMGFALGRVSPLGVRRRSTHIIYSRPVRSYTRLMTFSQHVRNMALRAEAECAGCVVIMPAVIQQDVQEGLTFDATNVEADARETVMIHAEQLFDGHRCWYSQVQVVDGEVNVTDFEELNVNPHPNHPNFLPVEMYGAATVYA